MIETEGDNSASRYSSCDWQLEVSACNGLPFELKLYAYCYQLNIMISDKARVERSNLTVT